MVEILLLLATFFPQSVDVWTHERGPQKFSESQISAKT